MIKNQILVFVGMYYCFSAAFPLCAISMWKDPIFSTALVLYSLRIFDLLTKAPQKKTIDLKLILLLLCVCLTRGNGIYIALFVTLILIALRLIKKLSLPRFFIIQHVAIILLVFVINGPVLTAANVEKRSEESIGVFLQQIAATVVYNGEMSDDDKVIVSSIMPLERYPERYHPGLVDYIKWDNQFDKDYVRNNRSEILTTWLSLLFKNPRIFFKSWALNTFGYWVVNLWELNNYDRNIVRAGTDLEKWGTYGIKQKNLLDNSLIDFRKLFSKFASTPSIAICFWIILLDLVICIIYREIKYIVLLLPSLGNIATLIIASPDCYWPRYGLSLLYLLPLTLLLPIILIQNQKRKQKSD